ncbi:hypothetical protein SDC9_180052 [bioreactor metagenome]|uniref:Uncharacterized protein n=1 Tax=bioreactor metagenome TaxID=1076179 RepID=A0A645H2M5_9ZZZZ
MPGDPSVQIVFQLAVVWFAGCRAGLNFPGVNASQRLIKSLGFFGGMRRNIELFRAGLTRLGRNQGKKFFADAAAAIFARDMNAGQL